MAKRLLCLAWACIVPALSLNTEAANCLQVTCLYESEECSNDRNCADSLYYFLSEYEFKNILGLINDFILRRNDAWNDLMSCYDNNCHAFEETTEFSRRCRNMRTCNNCVRFSTDLIDPDSKIKQRSCKWQGDQCVIDCVSTGDERCMAKVAQCPFELADEAYDNVPDVLSSCARSYCGEEIRLCFDEDGCNKLLKEFKTDFEVGVVEQSRDYNIFWSDYYDCLTSNCPAASDPDGGLGGFASRAPCHLRDCTARDCSEYLRLCVELKECNVVLQQMVKDYLNGIVWDSDRANEESEPSFFSLWTCWTNEDIYGGCEFKIAKITDFNRCKSEFHQGSAGSASSSNLPPQMEDCMTVDCLREYQYCLNTARCTELGQDMVDDFVRGTTIQDNNDYEFSSLYECMELQCDYLLDEPWRYNDDASVNNRFEQLGNSGCTENFPKEAEGLVECAERGVCDNKCNTCNNDNQCAQLIKDWAYNFEAGRIFTSEENTFVDFYECMEKECELWLNPTTGQVSEQDSSNYRYVPLQMYQCTQVCYNDLRACMKNSLCTSRMKSMYQGYMEGETVPEDSNKQYDDLYNCWSRECPDDLIPQVDGSTPYPYELRDCRKGTCREEINNCEKYNTCYNLLDKLKVEFRDSAYESKIPFKDEDEYFEAVYDCIEGQCGVNLPENSDYYANIPQNEMKCFKNDCLKENEECHKTKRCRDRLANWKKDYDKTGYTEWKRYKERERTYTDLERCIETRCSITLTEEFYVDCGDRSECGNCIRDGCKWQNNECDDECYFDEDSKNTCSGSYVGKDGRGEYSIECESLTFQWERPEGPFTGRNCNKQLTCQACIQAGCYYDPSIQRKFNGENECCVDYCPTNSRGFGSSCAGNYDFDFEASLPAVTIQCPSDVDALKDEEQEDLDQCLDNVQGCENEIAACTKSQACQNKEASYGPYGAICYFQPDYCDLRASDVHEDTLGLKYNCLLRKSTCLQDRLPYIGIDEEAFQDAWTVLRGRLPCGGIFRDGQQVAPVYDLEGQQIECRQNECSEIYNNVECVFLENGNSGSRGVCCPNGNGDVTPKTSITTTPTEPFVFWNGQGVSHDFVSSFEFPDNVRYVTYELKPETGGGGIDRLMFNPNTGVARGRITIRDVNSFKNLLRKTGKDYATVEVCAKTKYQQKCTDLDYEILDSRPVESKPPSLSPTGIPSVSPTPHPTNAPSVSPTGSPSNAPTTGIPTTGPTKSPSIRPTTLSPSTSPTNASEYSWAGQIWDDLRPHCEGAAIFQATAIQTELSCKQGCFAYKGPGAPCLFISWSGVEKQCVYKNGYTSMEPCTGCDYGGYCTVPSGACDPEKTFCSSNLNSMGNGYNLPPTNPDRPDQQGGDTVTTTTTTIPQTPSPSASPTKSPTIVVPTLSPTFRRRDPRLPPTNRPVVIDRIDGGISSSYNFKFGVDIGDDKRKSGPSVSAKSCGELNWKRAFLNPSVCGASKVDDGRCPLRLSYKEAVETCSAAGARLCTLKELRDDVTEATGCLLDYRRIWSATPCEGGHVTVAGSSKGMTKTPVSCGTEVNFEFVRCCANVKGRFTDVPRSTDEEGATKSALSCSELKWPLSSVPRKCGGSAFGDQCSGRVSFAQANQMCKNIHARLCTSLELSRGVAAGTGCEQDNKRVWSATECRSGVVAQAGGGSRFTEIVPMCAPVSYRYNVRCCADQFPSGVRSKKSCAALLWKPSVNDKCAASEIFDTTLMVKKCPPLVKFKRAQNICLSIGARLCTPKELIDDEAQGTGCLLDKRRVWSSAPCGSGRAQTMAGSRAGHSIVARECTRKDSLAGVRCCADRTVPSSTKSIQPNDNGEGTTDENGDNIIEMVRNTETDMLRVSSPRRTCKSLGWPSGPEEMKGVCAQTLIYGGECPKLMFREDAEAMCSEVGGRLCSVVELFSGVAKKLPCLSKDSMVHTASECEGANSFLVASPMKAGQTDFDYECSRVDEEQRSFGVVCCSDAELEIA